MAVPCYNDVLIFFITALLGSVVVFNVANSKIWDYFGRFDFLRFLGQNSLVAFCTHKIWIVVYLKLLYKITGQQFEAMVNIPYSYCLIGLVLVMIVLYPTIAIIKPLYNIMYANVCRLFRLK